MITINIILSFNKHGQQFFDLSLPDNDITKEQFLTIIFDLLNGIEIRDLMKISTCQYAKPEDCIKWLWEENGKLYFNIDVNDDDDTQENYDLKKKYCKEEEGEYYIDF